MNKAILVVALVALILVVAGCHSTTAGCPGCAKMEKTGTGWCDDCGEGMVNGQKVECKGCYTAMTGGPACPMHSK